MAEEWETKKREEWKVIDERKRRGRRRGRRGAKRRRREK